MHRYREVGFPEQYGLFETGIMIRNNRSRRLKGMCRIWANELVIGSKRDQLSLNYSIWKSGNNIRIKAFDRKHFVGLTGVEDFVIKPHKK